MSFADENVEVFLQNFNEYKRAIRQFEGCQFLELYRDKTESHIFFTYSFWIDESALDAYRQSKLFKSVWSKTKPLFNDKPQAWSVDKIVSLP
jgi:hypothetical protein